MQSSWLNQIISNQSATPTQQIPQQNPNEAFLQNLRQITNNLKTAQNPQSMLQNMILQNPRLNEAMAFIKQMGSPEQALAAMAKQRGLDPTQILNGIKNL